MKKILIYDVAAEKFGAERILEIFVSLYPIDQYQTHIMLGRSGYRAPDDKTRVIKLPWVKKSWLHRLYCDLVYAPEYIRKHHIDEIISLQNMAVPFCRVKQTVYVQNCIPFSEYRVGLATDPFVWFYKNVIGRWTVYSLKYASHIIVQTEWMKKLVKIKTGTDADRISVKRVMIPDYQRRKRRTYRKKTVFFYPAAAYQYKNHQMILEALINWRHLNQENFERAAVIFTISENENRYARHLSKIVRQYHLPVKFSGRQNQDRMAELYAASVLLFPSHMETVGLPLLEAQQSGCRIIAADYEYARESIGSYDKAVFFDPSDTRALAAILDKEAEIYWKNKDRKK